MSLLTLSLSTGTADSETVTTGNLLPNANDGVDWNSSSTDQINPGGSGYVTSGSTVNGFDVTCTNQSNCGYKYSVGGDFEVTGTTTLSVDDIALTNNSINQSMLDNGITLNSHIDVANCESTEGNCESKGGANDTHTTTIVLKDSSGNTLSTTTQTRNEVTGFKGNCNGYPGSSATGVTAACGQYNDTVVHNDVGANKVDWSWSGTDSNYTNQSRQGPNLLGARLTMTYNNTEYDPIDEDVAEDLEDIAEDIAEDIPDFEDDFTWEDDFSWEEEYFTWEEDFYFEEDFSIGDDYIIGDWEMDYEMEFNEDMYFEMEEEFVEMEMPEEMEMTMMPEEEFEEMYFEEEFDEGAFMEMPEEFETMAMEEEFTEMEMVEEFEEMPEEMEMEEEFTEMEMEEEFEEMEAMEEEPTEMEVVEEEETIDMEGETEEDVVEMEGEEEEMEVAENDNSMEEPKEDEESSEGSEEAVEEEPESEESSPEAVEDEEETIAETDVADEGGITTKNIEVSKEIKIKDVDVGEIKVSVDPRDIFKEVVSLDSYSNKDFYQDKGLQYEVNDDFFDQLSMIEYSKEIYKGVTLVTYIQGDPIEIYKRELEELAIQKAGIMIELKLLRGE